MEIQSKVFGGTELKFTVLNRTIQILAALFLLLVATTTFGQTKCLSDEEAKRVLTSISNAQNAAENRTLRRELLKMQESRQNLNQKIIDYSENNQKYISEADALGEKHLLRLCEVIRESGWLRKESVGEDGVSAVAFLLENSKNAELQREIFPVVAAAAKKGYVRNATVAHLIDSIRVSAGLPQVFGTQTEIKDELFYLYPIQNEAKVDDLRKLYGLPPLWEFFKYAQSWLQMPVVKIPRPPNSTQAKNKVESMNPLDDPLSNPEAEVVRVESRLVNLNVRIPVDISTGEMKFSKEDFTVYENGQQQEIKFFSAEEQPIDLVLMLDMRGWTREMKDLTNEYARRFIKAARPSDRIATFTFDGINRIFTPLTKNQESFLTNTEIADNDRSGIWSEVRFALDKIIKPQAQDVRQSVIVIITDGDDGNLKQRVNPNNESVKYSKTTFTELLETVRNGETTIIPLYLDTEKERNWQIPENSEIRGVLEEKHQWVRKALRQGRRTLWLLAEESGGQMYYANKPEDLDGSYGKILSDLRKTYSLGYEPSNNSRDGSWRSISVQVKNRSNLKILAKKGYYAN